MSVLPVGGEKSEADIVPGVFNYMWFTGFFSILKSLFGINVNCLEISLHLVAQMINHVA